MNKHIILGLAATMFSVAAVAAGTDRQDTMPHGSMNTGTKTMEQQRGMQSGDNDMQHGNGMAQNSRAGISGMLSFGAMDKDGDGSISHDEFESALRDQWQQADENQDGKISESEFSAFEQRGGMSVDESKPAASESEMGGGTGHPPN